MAHSTCLRYILDNRCDPRLVKTESVDQYPHLLCESAKRLFLAYGVLRNVNAGRSNLNASLLI